jgi:TPP-dependent 2-oxoacid decarboxylase
MKTGGQLIVDALEANGTDRIFCVPGESYLAVLDALHDSTIRTIVCRQEGGAAMMADCQGRLTGKPGICFVTRGPGATNSSPNGWSRSTTPRAFPNSSPAPSRWRLQAVPARWSSRYRKTC